MQKFLVIQTAFIGDVVLATGLIEKLHAHFPDAQLDFLLRKGNEALLTGHPYLHEVLIWDKKKHKLKNLWNLLWRIRRTKYDKTINVQRFAATGLLTAFSGAKETIGFDKNPLSRLFSKRIKHVVSYQLGKPGEPRITGQSAGPGEGHAPQPGEESTPQPSNRSAPQPSTSHDTAPAHEIDRNQLLIKDFTDPIPAKPRLYPTAQDYEVIKKYQQSPYITVGPASIWFTKQYPAEKWVDFIRKVPAGYTICLLGAPTDKDLCESILQGASMQDPIALTGASPDKRSGIPAAPARSILNLAGKLNFLQSVALMQGAAMNYTNDSAPMHFASAGNAPVTAVYCSTIPAFGFGPLSDKRFIVEIAQPLDCRPCGLHGYKACPLGHFRCAYAITDEQLLATLP